MLMHEYMNEWMDAWINEWTNKQTNEWINEWIQNLKSHVYFIMYLWVQALLYYVHYRHSYTSRRHSDLGWGGALKMCTTTQADICILD